MIQIIYMDDSGAARTIDLHDTSRTHTSSVVTTDSPVERSPNISDHVRYEPSKVSIKAVVSNQEHTQISNVDGATISNQIVPVSSTENATVKRWDISFNRIQSVYDDLKALQKSGKVCTIITPLETFENMVLTIQAPITTVDAVEFQIDGKQIKIVETQAAALGAAAQVRGRARVPAGAQQAATAGADPSSVTAQAPSSYSSLAYQVREAARSGIGSLLRR